MSVSALPEDARLLDLLAARATEGLDAPELVELDRAIADYPGLDRDELARPAAALHVACLGASAAITPMPGELRVRLAAEGERMLAAKGNGRVVDLRVRRATRASGGRPPGRLRAPWDKLGWAAAAALAMLLVLPRAAPPPSADDPADLRARLLREADDTVTLPWAPSGETGFSGVTGDVVWSDARQEGYMRFTALAPNDPLTSQYQLWIIDPERDERPVDGGVFDIPLDARDIVVPIHAKLAVEAPTAFAVTLEQPGGVVVSDGPLLLVAPRG